MNIAKIMTPKYSTACLQEDSTVRQGLEIMRRYGYTAIPVLDQTSAPLWASRPARPRSLTRSYSKTLCPSWTAGAACAAL